MTAGFSVAESERHPVAAKGEGCLIVVGHSLVAIHRWIKMG